MKRNPEIRVSSEFAIDIVGASLVVRHCVDFYVLLGNIHRYDFTVTNHCGWGVFGDSSVGPGIWLSTLRSYSFKPIY